MPPTAKKQAAKKPAAKKPKAKDNNKYLNECEAALKDLNYQKWRESSSKHGRFSA